MDLKTDRLPRQFIFLGYFLIVLGVIDVAMLNWRGLIFIFLGIIFVLIRSGVVLREDGKVKSYTGLPGIKPGKWEKIQPDATLHVVHRKEAYALNFLSIGTRTAVDTYRLYLSLKDKDLELASGEHDKLVLLGNKVADFLDIELVQK